MSKVVLSNGYEFELIADGYSADAEGVHFSIQSGDKTLEEIEQIFSGIDTFKVIAGEDMSDPAIVANYYGYTRVQNLSKIPEYYIGVDQETGDAIYVAVTTVSCIKRAIEDRISDVEDSIDDIVMTILGGDDLLADLGTEEPVVEESSNTEEPTAEETTPVEE